MNFSRNLFGRLMLAVGLLSAIPAWAVISVNLNGSTLYVYGDSGQQIMQWNDYKSHRVHGNYIGLLDTKGIFAAVRSDGKVLVNNYTNTQKFWLRDTFVAVLDTTGVFDAYLVSDGTRFINNWTKVVTADVGYDYIGLLDSDGVFDAYNYDGTAIVKNYKDTKEFHMMGDYLAVLDKNGIFDVYGRDGHGIVRNWRDTKDFRLQPTFIALLDTAGVLQVYRLDGSEAVHQTGVTAVEANRSFVRWMQNGQWQSFAM